MPRKPVEQKTSWAYGDMKKLAERTGVSRSHLCNVLGRKASMTKEKARLVSAVARRMGYRLTTADLFNPWVSENPLLRDWTPRGASQKEA